MTAKGRPHGTTTSKDGGLRRRRCFRASDAEWRYMHAIAHEYGQSVSELIRECLLVDMPETREQLPSHIPSNQGTKP